jgi:uncharacterized protein YndB with AHSA1/START domain
LNAPAEKIWEILTKPEHIKHWWGPDGFTNIIEKMQVKAGGEWVFTMFDRDGHPYPNKALFREVVRFKKLGFEHFDPNFITIIDLESVGDKTLLNWYKLYETKELFELVEKQHQSSVGFKQTIEKMKAYLMQHR